MTLEELLEMPIGTGRWDDEIFINIIRVPGGWIYSFWDTSKDLPATSTFVPEPKYC